MSYPFSHDRGDVAVEPEEETPPPHASGLLSVLEVGGRLYSRVAEALHAVGLTQPEYELLTHLQADGGLELDRLAQLMRRSTAALRSLVDELAERGLVLVHADDAAADAPRAALTRMGAERAREGRMRLGGVLDEFATRVGTEERLALDRLLAKWSGS